ncbi:MAG: rubrerythrin family protein [Clostridiales bacterium]|nr:rubrerythrin family protein [Clostridiales bacterium]
MDFQQSRTYQNILNAYEFQLRANAKYGLFSKKAGQENLIGISFSFDDVSRNEQFIAERLRRVLFGGDLDTLQNLYEASEEEQNESNLYREYSQIAIEEGYNDLASLFSGIANIKLNHNAIFQSYIEAIERDELFCKNDERLWVCLGCGNILSGLCAPARCPVCGYPQGYYVLLETD